MKLWQRNVAGMGLGMLAAPITGALIGGLYGVPFPCEPSWITGGAGVVLGAMVYGVVLVIPTALVGAIVGGIVSTNRPVGGEGKAEPKAPADRPRD